MLSFSTVAVFLTFHHTFSTGNKPEPNYSFSYKLWTMCRILFVSLLLPLCLQENFLVQYMCRAKQWAEWHKQNLEIKIYWKYWQGGGLIFYRRLFYMCLDDSATSTKEWKAIYRKKKKKWIWSSFSPSNFINVISMLAGSLWILQTMTSSIHTSGIGTLGLCTRRAGSAKCSFTH